MSTLVTVPVRRRAWLEGAAGRDRREPWGWFVLALRWGGAAVLAGLVAAFVWMSRRWPVVNDAALMHYVVFLLRHGMAPYRQVHDINLPGAYLPDWVAMRVGDLGLGGDLAWRLYDFGLLGVATGAMVWIVRRQDWFAGVFAGGLLALLHGRDGIGQAGQRDLAVAVLCLLGVAAWLEGVRRARGEGFGAVLGVGPRVLFGCFGLALGAATTVKPFGILLFGVLGAGLWRDRAALSGEWSWASTWAGGRAGAAGLAAAVGFSLPVVAVVIFLLREHALASFVSMCRVALPFHAEAARPGWSDLLRSAFPKSLLKLGALALAIMLLRGSWRWRQTQVLLLGVGFGLVCFAVQEKGYSYQRYPYVVFLLLWVGVECTAAVRARGVLLRSLGATGLLFGICLCAPSYLHTAAKARWQEPYLGALEQDLRSVAGPGGLAELNGRVQCVDSISGCVNVLYRMGLEQATGTIYDEFLFPTAGAARDEAVVGAQRSFLRELDARPPRVFVVASWLFPEGPGGYAKLDRWPAFRRTLDRDYRVVDERVFARSENGPMGFRVYVRR